MKTSIKAILASLLFSSLAFAQSAKNALQVSDLTLIPRAAGIASDGTWSGDWQPLLNASLHTSQQKDLVISSSLEVGLFTDTKVSSQKGNTSSSSAEAMVEVRVVIDPGTASERVAAPGVVTFNKRSQTMIAQFGGVLQSCTDSNLDGTITLDECIWTDETLQLMLDTLSANAFFFAVDNLGAGDHRVQVQARVSYGLATSGGGTGSANAWVGKGALTVEEVRLVKDANISL